MIFIITNAALKLMLTIIAAYKLTQFREMMHTMERVGLGLMGGGGLLTAPNLFDPHGPFEGWATFILTLGAVLFLLGRTIRDRRHDKANIEAVGQARTYLAARGKI